jgi:hypothetical protein
MTVTSGKEVSESVSTSAGFSGRGSSAEVSGSTETKTSKSIETSSIREVEDPCTCPPESSVSADDKRRYKLRCRTRSFSEPQNAWCGWNGSRMRSCLCQRNHGQSRADQRGRLERSRQGPERPHLRASLARHKALNLA